MADPWTFGWTQLLTIVGFIITICIAVGGFRTFERWRKEKLEERRIELALEALAVAYQVRAIFDAIRNPGSFDYEWKDMPRWKGETDHEWSARGAYYATLKRLDDNKDFFLKVWDLQPRFVAMFGPETEDNFKELQSARVQVLVSANSLMRRKGKQEEWGEKQQQRHAQMETDIWGGDDEYAPEGDRVAKKLEAFRSGLIHLCRPIVDMQYRKEQIEAAGRWTRWLGFSA